MFYILGSRLRKLFEERHPVHAPFTMGDIWVHDREVARETGKVYPQTGLPDSSGRINVIIRGFLPCWVGLDAPNDFLLG